MPRIKGRCPECGGKGVLYRYCVFVCVRCKQCHYCGTKVYSIYPNAADKATGYWDAVANIKGGT